MDSASPTRSDLVSTTTGRAPLSHASARKRSIRPMFGSGTRPTTIAITSTLAASTWPSGRAADLRPDDRRTAWCDGLERDPVVRPVPQYDPVPCTWAGLGVTGHRGEECTGPGRADRTVLGENRRQALVDPGDASRHELVRDGLQVSAVELSSPRAWSVC